MTAQVVVEPSTFELVEFDAGEIARIAGEIAEAIGLPADVAVRITVDETAIIGRISCQVLDGDVVVEATGGAFESLRKARQFAPDRCRAALGQALMRARDRLDPAFGSPPPDADLPLALETTWATYVEGRLARVGVVDGRQQRRLYHFRVRHGFEDATDAVFLELWNGSGLTWDDLVEASERAAAMTPA